MSEKSRVSDDIRDLNKLHGLDDIISIKAIKFTGEGDPFDNFFRDIVIRGVAPTIEIIEEIYSMSEKTDVKLMDIRPTGTYQYQVEMLGVGVFYFPIQREYSPIYEEYIEQNFR